MKKEKILKLFISISIPLLAGFVGSYFTTPNIAGWYAELQKPALNPPNWIFAPVWTTLYILMGISLFLIWEKVGKMKKNVLLFFVFFLQLILNSLWSIIFFGLQNPGVAMINIVLLWTSLVATIFIFWKESKVAGYLLLPYLAWISFATYLNYMIWQLN